MALQFIGRSGAVSLTAATAKTALMVTASANTPAELIALDVSSTYVTSATPASLLIEILTTSTTGTATTVAATRYGTAAGTANATFRNTFTAEPTLATTVQEWVVILPGGPFSYQWPLGRELMLQSSTNYTVRLTCSAAVTAYADLTFEE